jgi:inner membrane protease subunit 1
MPLSNNLVSHADCGFSRLHKQCAGPSMYPTLALSGDVLVSLRMSTLRTFITRTPPHVSRGDLIDFVSPRDPTYSACKRVIGVEGDVVCLDPSKPPSAFTKQLMRAAHVAEEQERRKKGAAILPVRTEASEEALPEEQDDIETIPHPFELESGPYIKVPTGYVWVVGDNLSNSEDSRQNGPLPLGLIRGKIIARVSHFTVRRLLYCQYRQ